ncbi:MAG: DUF5658 family protein [Armatimonadota bacterium]|nr:DUF5658 family protein [Armatimonadota bacterium]
MSLMRETWILMAICLLDLATTLGLTAGRRFTEGNPIMSYYLELGVWAFVGAKLLLVVMPLIVAEYSRRFKPRFVRTMLRFAIAAYVAAYVMLFLGFNLEPLTQEAFAPAGAASTATEVLQMK